MEKKEERRRKYKDIIFEKVDARKLTVGRAMELYRNIRVHSECNANKIILMSLSIEDLN